MSNLDKAPTLFRATLTRGKKSKVERTGGNYNAGVIRNFAVITVGEALGHNSWVDATFLEQVATQLSAEKKGIKGRYTHPGQSGDSLSKGLGRAVYTQSDDGKIYGDFHFWKAAHRSPDGDLAGFVMDLTEEDPEALGASISFHHDEEAMEDFAEEYPESPDKLNVNNYPHVRLGKLRFVDIVDEPAANPDGMFHQDNTFTDAEKLFEYALGLSDVKPETQFGIDADRLHGFCKRFLEIRNLEMKLNLPSEETQELNALKPEAVEVEVAEVEEVEAVEVEVEEVEVVEVEAVEAPESDGSGTDGTPTSPVGASGYKADLEKYISNFGKEAGVDYFIGEVDFTEAMSDFIGKQKEQIAQLKNTLEVERQSEAQPLSARDGETAAPSKGQGMFSKIKLPN